MGDHYSCGICQQHYNYCRCARAEPAKPVGFPREEKLTIKVELSGELKDELAKLNTRLDEIQKEVARLKWAATR